MIQKVKNKEFDFVFSKPMEFMYALIATSLMDVFIKDEDGSIIKSEKKLINIVENLKSKLSRYTKSELQYFFHINVDFCSGIGQLIFMGYLKENPEVDTIEKMIKVIEKSDTYTMLLYVVESVFYENQNKSIRDIYKWDDIRNDLNEMLEILKKLQFYDKDMKEKVIECIENAEETKQRYCVLLKLFYEKVYKTIEGEVCDLVDHSIKEYESEFNNDPVKFCRNYFAKDINVFAPKVYIHLSYFRFAGSDYWSSRLLKEKPEWICLGSATMKYCGEESNKEKVLDFLKAVSDRKRMDIIEFLAEEPRYVNEVAEKIGMSAATTSYHLTTLQELGIVDFERYDHRFYYHLNKDKLKELFNEAMKAFTHE